MDYLLVVLLGVLVGAGELTSRYRDAPWTSVTNVAAGAYLATNAFAAAFALMFIRSMPLTFGMETARAIRATQVMVAGFGAMALFRTSLFFMRIGGRDVGIGPSTFLQVILSATDRDVDRRRAVDRAAAVTKALEGMEFDQIREALPRYCLTLMQNVSMEEEAEIERAVAEIAGSGMDSSLKANALGLSLMNVVGRNVLVAAAASVKSRIVQQGVLNVYPRLLDAIKQVAIPEHKTLDVIGLTLYTAWPQTRSWLEQDTSPLDGWTIRLRCMASNPALLTDRYGVDPAWWEEADTNAAEIEDYARTKSESLTARGVSLSVQRYVLIPNFHGFRVGSGTYLISFLTWDEETGWLSRPHDFYEIIASEDDSKRAHEYRRLFDNWLVRMDRSIPGEDEVV